MRKLLIISLGALAIAVFCLLLVRKDKDAALSVRVLNATNDGGLISVTMEVSNHMRFLYFVVPVRVEALNDHVWEKAPPYGIVMSQSDELIGRTCRTGSCVLSCDVKPPTAPARRLRIVLEAHRVRSGISTYWLRVKRRLLHGDQFSLNPFDSTPVVYPDRLVVTESFEAP